MVDYGSSAVTARLQEVSRLLSERGFINKQVDMSAAALTARLRTMASLSDMCRRLVDVGDRLRRGG